MDLPFEIVVIHQSRQAMVVFGQFSKKGRKKQSFPLKFW